MSDVSITVVIISAGILVLLIYLLHESLKQQQTPVKSTKQKANLKRNTSITIFEQPLDSHLDSPVIIKKIKFNSDKDQEEIPPTPTFQKFDRKINEQVPSQVLPLQRKLQFKPYIQEETIIKEQIGLKNHKEEKKDKIQKKVNQYLNRSDFHATDLFDQKLRLISGQLNEPSELEPNPIKHNLLDVSFSNQAMNYSPSSPKQKIIFTSNPQIISQGDEMNIKQFSFPKLYYQDEQLSPVKIQDQQPKRIQLDFGLDQLLEQEQQEKTTGIKRMNKTLSQQRIHQSHDGLDSINLKPSKVILDPSSDHKSDHKSLLEKPIIIDQKLQLPIQASDLNFYKQDENGSNIQPGPAFRMISQTKQNLFQNLLLPVQPTTTSPEKQKMNQNLIDQNKPKEGEPSKLFGNLVDPIQKPLPLVQPTIKSTEKQNLFQNLFDQNKPKEVEPTKLFDNLKGPTYWPLPQDHPTTTSSDKQNLFQSQLNQNKPIESDGMFNNLLRTSIFQPPSLVQSVPVAQPVTTSSGIFSNIQAQPQGLFTNILNAQPMTNQNLQGGIMNTNSSNPPKSLFANLLNPNVTFNAANQGNFFGMG